MAFAAIFRRERLAACVWCLLVPSSVWASTIGLAWDPNPEPEVVGYIVYVGTESGQYRWTYDVGPNTTFDFPEAIDGGTYFFSVAAYTSDRTGLKSNEVSGTASSATPAFIAETAAPPATAFGSSRELHGPPVCASRLFVCDSVRVLANSPSSIGDVITLADRRALYIEDERRVRMTRDDVLLPGFALDVVSPEVRLTGLALDPQFAHTGHVFVGQIVQSNAGPEFGIWRYRMAGGVLGEPAPVISGIAVGADAVVPFVIDSERHVYIAVPISLDEGPYDGYVLRFNADGTVPREQGNGSPILAHGLARPAALLWDASTESIWLSGEGRDSSPRLAFLELGARRGAWPYVLKGTAIPLEDGSTNAPRLMRDLATVPSLLPGSASSLLQLEHDRLIAWTRGPGESRGMVAAEWDAAAEVPTNIAADNADYIYVATRRMTSTGATHALVRIRLRAKLE